MPLSAEQLAARVEAVIFDVDGVLTRGDIVYGVDTELKVFNVQDGLGFELARRGGLKTALFSGRESGAVRRRAQELSVDVLKEGVKDKGQALAALLGELGVVPEQVCYTGDDLPDVPVLQAVGFPVAVANAVAEAKEAAAWVTSRRGGDAAAREVIEFVLKARGVWQDVLGTYCRGTR